jgi:hypothetical protein
MNFSKETIYKAMTKDHSRIVVGVYFIHQVRYPNVFTNSENDIEKPEDYQHLIITDGFADWGLKRPIEDVEIDPNTLIKFTGRFDCTKTRIFENDIIKIKGISKQFKVVWADEPYFSFMLKETDNPSKEDLVQFNYSSDNTIIVSTSLKEF